MDNHCCLCGAYLADTGRMVCPKCEKRKCNKKKTRLKSCGCDMFIPFGFGTWFIGIPLYHTVMCVSCQKKARGRTLEKAIEVWNRRAGNG